MVSRKLLVAVICLALLLSNVAIISYIIISGLQNDVDSLQETISGLEEEIAELVNEVADLENDISHMQNTANFTFLWTSVSQAEFPPLEVIVKPLNETLRMELVFTIKNENLSIIATINDDTPYYLGVALDKNGDGKLDAVYPLFDDNRTYIKPPTPIGLSDYGGLSSLPTLPTEPSPFHTCVIEEGTTTFNVTLPLPLGPLVHICYRFDLGWVYVRFDSGLPLGE